MTPFLKVVNLNCGQKKKRNDTTRTKYNYHLF